MWQHIGVRADRYVNTVVALRRALNQWYRLDNALMDLRNSQPSARAGVEPVQEALDVQADALHRALDMLQGESDRPDGR
jgi:hypothetical protein